jgi:DNA polymerase-3 subunit epsilon
MPTLDEFKQIIKSGNYVVLDTETTGLNNAEIVQISIIDSNGQVLLDTLIKPVRPIPEDAIRIHHITNEMVSDKPGMMYFYNQIKNLLAGRNVVVFNVAYDRQILYDSLEIAHLEKVEWNDISNWLCAMEAFSEVKGEWNAKRKSFKWQSLSKACDYYQIPLQNAHNALGDCQMTLNVCKRIADVQSVSAPVLKQPAQSAPASTYRMMYEDI